MQASRYHRLKTVIYQRLRNRSLRYGLLGIAVAGIFALLVPPQAGHGVDPVVGNSSHAGMESSNPLLSAYGRLPLRFEENRGQTDEQVKFLARGAGYALFLTPTETVISLQKPGAGIQDSESKGVSLIPDPGAQPTNIVRMELQGGNRETLLEGANELPGKVNYLLGRDKSDWHTDVPTYAAVRAGDVYPGIDLRYHGDQRQMEYDFIVSPEAGVDTIRLAFTGVDNIEINAGGDLVLKTADGELHHKKPYIYQEINGKQITVEGAYRLIPATLHASQDTSTEHRGPSPTPFDSATGLPMVGFQVAAYNKNHDLIIDPVLDYSTYLGGEAADTAKDIAIDGSGNAYITGQTLSAAFPTLGALQSARQGSADGFVVKLSAAGDSLIYSTYFGGSGADETGNGIAVNAVGEVFVTGTTNSTDFPIVNAFQPGYGGGVNDAFLVKLSSSGGSIIYSTFLGGKKSETGRDVAVDSLDQAVIIGGSNTSGQFPLVNPLLSSLNGNGNDGFISKFSADGAGLIFSTFFGGTDEDVMAAVAVDSSDRIYVTGETASTDFLIANALQPLIAGSLDAFVARLQPDGTVLDFSTFFGGSLADGATAVAIDSTGNIIITGTTSSNSDFPLAAAVQSVHGGGQDAFVTKLTPDATAVIFSTYLGGSGNDSAAAAAVDGLDYIYVAGETASAAFPTVDPLQATLAGSSDAFISHISPAGDQLLFSSFLGGSGVDSASAVAIDGTGNILLAGSTASSLDFPLLNPMQPVFGGVTDAFVVSISNNLPPEITSTPITSAERGEPYSYDVEATDPDSDPLTYSLTIFPTGMLIDPGTGVITWTPDTLGGFSVSVVVDDGQGGTVQQDYTLSVVDTTAPIIIISSPQNGLLTNQSGQTITGSLSEAATLTMNAQPVSVNPDLSFSVAVTLIEGGNSYTFSATDSSSNTGGATLNLTLDSTAPVIGVTAPADGFLTNLSVVTVSGTLSETATLTINGQGATVAPDLSFSEAVTLTLEGTNTIALTATDPAGNIGNSSLTVSRDSIAPLITVTAPADGSSTNLTGITVTGTVSELASLVINGQAAQVNGDGSFSHGPVALISEGANAISLTATDAAGNTGVAALTVNRDTTLPVITVTAPVNGLITSQASQTFTGSLSEAAQLFINGASVPVNPDNSFSIGPVTLGEGQNLFTFTATDGVGNSATPAAITLTLDTITPVLIVNTPLDNTLTNQAGVTFSGSVSEAVVLTINGQVVIQSGDNSFNAVITLTEGANAVPVIATDPAANSATQTLNITVDTTPPVAPNPALINRGNPANGIVMVSGLPGAVEAGTLLHIINTATNFEALALVQSDGSFSADIAAFANDSFSLFAVDAAANQSPAVTLAPSTPLTLTLDPIGNKTAPLGRITRFTVTANDSIGDPIVLGLTPLPLPDNMEYNIATGELLFQPAADQAGDYTLIFSARSGDELVSETITVTVPPANPADPTVFTGRILDATGMQGGSIIPIVGATISFLETGVVITTDSEGYFTLNALPATATVFDIDGSTALPGPGGALYASFREGLPLISNVTNLVERPFYMPRLATESITSVDPAQTTVVNNPTLGITLTVPPGTAINDADGLPFTGDLSISLVPRDLAPANLPEHLDLGMLVTIQPVGVSYTTPVPITFPNPDNLEPETDVDIWSVDPNLGQFVVVGTGRVTLDGQSIETIAGGIRANDWHGPSPGDPLPDPNGAEEQDPDNGCPKCPEVEGGSSFSLHDGHMSTGFTLPAYRSLEANRALRFNYRSFRAYPRPVVEFSGRIGNNIASPETISYKLEVAGLEQGQEVFVDTSGFNPRGNEPFRTAISFDGHDFASGIYDYTLTVSNNYTTSSRARIQPGRVMVENETASPFGAGWMLNGLYRLAFNAEGADTSADDSITLIASDGRSITYRPSGAPNEFNAPDNDFAVFARNLDGSYTHTEKDGVKMFFDAAGLLTSRVDRNGNTTSYIYDPAGNLTTLTDPVGLATLFVYDINGLLESVTDPAGRISSFEHDPLGNLIKINYPDGSFETFEYDGRHLLTAHEDERGNRFTDRYDTFGRVIDGTLPDGTVRAAAGKTAKGLVDVSSGLGTLLNPAPVTRPADVDGDYVDGRGNASSKTLDAHGRTLVQVDEVGRVTEHVRDADSNPTQTTRPIGSVVTRTFDNLGNVLTQREEFNSATTTYTYDPFSLVTSVTNPRNHVTTINRDPVNGNPLSIVNPLLHTTTMEYDAPAAIPAGTGGLVTRTTSPNGLVTDYTYNPQGLMATKTEIPPVGSPGNVRLWSYDYYPTGLLQTVITPDNITLTYSYDERGYLLSVTDNLNQSIVYTYDEHKNVIKTESTSGDGSLALLVESVFDNRNRLVTTKAPHVGIEESITQRTLDENSNLIGLIDPNGNASSNSYDPSNRLATNTHREDGITEYVYDNQNRIIQVTAPNGVITKYEYDIIGRRTREISPDRGTLGYIYDLANNVTSITDGRGITATMTYDELERVATKTYPNTIGGKNENVTYTYDTCTFGNGYLCARTDESGGYSYEYDGFGNLTQMSFTEIAGITYTMGYVYDDGDHVIQTTYPSGRVLDYTRDGLRRVEAIDTTINGTPQTLLSGIQYRGDNQITQATLGNGLIDERLYDLQGRLTHQQLRTAASLMIDERSYSYDKNSNILNIATNVEDNAYLYDKLDRITSDSIDTNSPIGYTYDLNDNRQSRQLADLTTDELIAQVNGSNRIQTNDLLKTGLDPIGALPNRDLVYNDVGRLYQLFEAGTLKAEYIYNDGGQRTRKVIHNPDLTTTITIYHYDQMGYLIEETTETGALIKDYIWMEGMSPVAQVDNTIGTENLLYLYTDHLMTNRLATDQSQAVVWRWEGEAFGNTPAQEIAGFSVNLRFPGQYFDQETNLHYNHFRYYDPHLGRYITSDPIGISGGLNTYLYGNANALSQLDIFGLFAPAYKHAWNDYSDRRGGYGGTSGSGDGSGDLCPRWSGGYLLGWFPCDCPPSPEGGDDSGSGAGNDNSDSNSESSSSSPVPSSGTGTGTTPGQGSTGNRSKGNGLEDLLMDRAKKRRCENLRELCFADMGNMGRTAAEALCGSSGTGRRRIPIPNLVCKSFGDIAEESMEIPCYNIYNTCMGY